MTTVRVTHLRCDNPGPMTLTGTNSYVVHAGERAVVVDPGPEDADGHQAALVAAVQGAQRVDVLLTHHHADHEGGAAAFVERVRATGPEVRLWGGASGQALRDGASIGPLQVLLAPGHTADSVVYLLDEGFVEPARDERGIVVAGGGESPPGGVLFSGDTVLGGSSSFIAHPDGDLTAYLLTLDTLEAVLEQQPATTLAPGHGEVGGSALDAVRAYVAHRSERLEQVQAVLAGLADGDPQAPAGDDTAPGVSSADPAPSGARLDAHLDAVVAAVYPDADAALRPAVEAIVRAQLAHLSRVGDLRQAR